MDADILRTILDSYSSDVARSKDHKSVTRESILYPQSEAFKNLCTSLSNLLCYKVSKEAHQRYSVKFMIIVC